MLHTTYTENNKAICPDCGVEHDIHPLSHYYIKRGIYKGYCQKCHIQRMVNANKVTHYISCPMCGEKRIVSSSVMYNYKIGRLKGYCKICTNLIKKNRNSGQFVKGMTPRNKGINPNMKEDRRLYKLKWREANRDKVNKYFTNYYNNHIEKSRMNSRVSKLNRRAVGAIDSNIIEILKDKYKSCYICGGELINWEIDHITPISLGGNNNIDNLALACRTCNRRKTNKTLGQYKLDLMAING